MCINDSTCPLKLGEGAGDLVFHWQCRWEAVDRRVRPHLAFISVSCRRKPAFNCTLYYANVALTALLDFFTPVDMFLLYRSSS